MAPLFTALLVLLSNLVLSASAACPQIDFRCFPNPDTSPFGCGHCAVNLTTLTPLTQCDPDHLHDAISMVSYNGSDLSISFSSNTTCMDSIHSGKPSNSACKVEIPGLISLSFPNIIASLFRCKTVPENDGHSPSCEDYDVLDVPPFPPHGCQSVPPPETLNSDILVSYEVPGKCGDCIRRGGQCEILSRGNFKREKGRNKLWLILGIGLAIPGNLALLLALVAFWRRRKCSCGSETLESRPTSFEPTKSDLELGNVFFGVPIFSYSMLEEATNNFDPARELGDGGFGVVYKGKLRDGREVAVKRLYEKNYRQVQQFINEVQILTCLRHPNLVALYGCTSRHSRELLLVYEYVSNGTVADHLYGDRAKSALLPWPVRLSIATETASALSYLHASDIIHRDVKTNNILLDHNFCVKVADFGLSRLFPNAVTHISTAPQGTPGYLDPEYHRCFQLTDKSDVYSFGVVLVQLISSLPAIDICRDYHDINLSHYAMKKIQQGALRDLVDPNLGFDSNSKVVMMITSVAELAFQCLQQEGELRPTMDEVLKTLKGIGSTDQEASETQKMDKYDETLHSPEKDDVGLLKSTVEKPQASPNSVMQNWLSRSATSSNS